MNQTECTRQWELFEVARRTVTGDFDGGDVVTDAGLLPLRQLDLELGILAEAARRLPDPRSQLFVTHSAERLLTQQVYQILAGDFDGDDAQHTRHDPLFKTLVGTLPALESAPLASGSTVNRFPHADTRRRIWFHLASHWPGRELFARASEAIKRFTAQLHQRWREAELFVAALAYDPRDRNRIHFAPLPLK